MRAIRSATSTWCIVAPPTVHPMQRVLHFQLVSALSCHKFKYAITRDCFHIVCKSRWRRSECSAWCIFCSTISNCTCYKFMPRLAQHSLSLCFIAGTYMEYAHCKWCSKNDGDQTAEPRHCQTKLTIQPWGDYFLEQSATLRATNGGRANLIS